LHLPVRPVPRARRLLPADAGTARRHPLPGLPHQPHRHAPHRRLRHQHGVLPALPFLPRHAEAPSERGGIPVRGPQVLRVPPGHGGHRSFAPAEGPMRTTLALAAALALGLLSRSASAAQRTGGKVEYATAGRLYLDAGARDGLVPGAVVALRRGEKAAGTCKVEVVSETHASCLGNGRVGDSFTLEGRAQPAETAPERRAEAAPLPDAEVTRRRRALENTAFEKVDFQGGARPTLLSGRTEVRLSYFTWASTGVGPW